MTRRYTNIIPSGIGKEETKKGKNKLKIHKNMVRRETSRNQIEPDEDGLPELRTISPTFPLSHGDSISFGNGH